MKKGATVEAQEKIMELREGALELQEENAKLKEENNKLQEKLNIRNHIEYDEGVYWLWEEDESGDYTVKIGPFCQHCYDDEKKLIRLQKRDIEEIDSESRRSYKTGNYYYRCFKCKNNYDGS